MRVGVAPVFQSHGFERSDYEVYQQELRLADLVEPLGFDSIWTTEHHFTDYEMVPSPLQFLTYMAGRTQRIGLGTMVIVVPWHDPLRLAEEISTLENLSGGRTILGLGRGLGRVEFEGFRVPIDESRGRFSESVPAILNSLETGKFELSGQFDTVPSRPLRPAPIDSFRGRVFIAGASPETAPFAVEMGAGLLLIGNKAWGEAAKDVKRYEDLWATTRSGEDRPRPILIGFTYVDRDAGRAEDVALKYMSSYYEGVLDHYEMRAKTFGEAKGYSHYKSLGDAAREDERSVTEGFAKEMVWGTPTQVIEKIESFRDMMDIGSFICHFSFAGMPYEYVSRSMRLFADEVLPVLHSWKIAAKVTV